MKSWYALYTKPNQEARVTRQFDELDIETYLPRTRLYDREKRLRTVPYFPCYLFAHMDLAATHAPRWQWTPGLRGVVAFASVPAVVPTAFIELLRSQLDEAQDTGRPAYNRFQRGDAVRVTKGPLVDLVGLIERENSATERVCILLNYLGRVCRVHLDAADLEKTALSPQPAELPQPRRTRGRGRPIRP